MSTNLQDFSPTAVSFAFDANLRAFWSQLFGHLPVAACHDEPGVFWFETGIHHDIFNRAMPTSLDLAVFPTSLERVRNHFQQRRLPFLWHMGASSHLTNEQPTVESYGLTHYETEPVMVADLHNFNEEISVAPQLAILPLNTDELLKQWVHVWELGSSQEVIDLWFTFYSGLCFKPESPLHLFLGILDGKPVATSEVFFGGGVALLGAVNTLSQHRRQGIGAALALAALRDAQKQGYRMSVLSASPMGINIYRRIGFREYGATLGTYLWHPQTVEA